ncbi:MAG: GAF domain-containing protein [Anaerolineales bacterium]|nr:MAG: GAF domain-containing protein [Anaerolineales bacterium]
MTKKTSQTSSLKPKELEAVYAISQVVAESLDIDEALDQITKIAREVFIFDSAVVYLLEEGEELKPFFARVIGRGQSSAANLVWGDMAALESIKTGNVYIRDPEIVPSDDRLDQQFYLSLPMVVVGNITGALVFIRFGGPVYTDDQINLAQFITTHVSQLFEIQRLVERIANLEAERRLAQMQDDFIAMVSHELNTPLGFIKGYTTTLLRQDTEWDENTQKEFLNIIDEEADRLNELIENLLDSYRLKSGTLEMNIRPTQLQSFFEAILERLNTSGINLDIQISVSPPDLTAIVDPKRLNQVIENLINNASKYAPNSSLTIRAVPDGDNIHITVIDSGPGIPANHLEHLFKRFYRVPERSAGVRGTGLGLYICQQIIHALDGEISVESTLNTGTTFHILLPLSEVPVLQEEVKHV